MENNIVFADLQGFKSNENDFIAKEVAAVFHNNQQHFNFIIEPTFDFKILTSKKQRESNWLTKHYHHLRWNDETVSYQSVCEFLKANIRHFRIYIKGEEKRRWLEKILQRSVLNMQYIGCINFKQMDFKYPDHPYCSYHSHGVCALRNSLLLSREANFLTL